MPAPVADLVIAAHVVSAVVAVVVREAAVPSSPRWLVVPAVVALALSWSPRTSCPRWWRWSCTRPRCPARPRRWHESEGVASRLRAFTALLPYAELTFLHY